jgi:hypothetical protein
MDSFIKLLSKNRDKDVEGFKDDEFLPATALYDKSMTKYVELYEDTVSDDEGTSSKSDKSDKDKDDDKEKKDSRDSKYSHSRFSS